MSWLFVISTLDVNLGGIARSVPLLALAVARAGIPVRCVAIRANQMTFDPISYDVWEKVALVENVQQVVKTVEQWTKSNEVSLIYHVGIWAAINHRVAGVGRRCGIPVVASPRSMLDPWARKHRRWKKRLAWWTYARRGFFSAAAVHVTADMEAGFVRVAGYEGPVITIPNGIDFPDTENTRVEAKTPGRFRLLFLSRIHEKKGLPDLLNAFGKLNDPDWELTIVGNDDGGHRPKCESLAKKLPNADRVHFVGAVSDAEKWGWYRSADLFVLPSHSENFGIVIGEALAVGIPVITTTATPWKSLEKRDCGWCVSPGFEELLQALKTATALDPETRQEMGQRGAEWMRGSFSWEQVGRQFVEQIHALRICDRHLKDGRRA